MNKITHKKILILLFLIGAFALTGYAETKIIDSLKLTTPINIDGKPGEWDSNAQFIDKRTKAECFFRNDGETFFILFVFKDPKYLSSVQSSGMTIWFNTEEKKKKDYGINFLTKRVSADDYITFLEQQKGALSEEEKTKIRQNPLYIFYQTDVKNKKKKESSEQTEKGETKPAFFRSEINRKAAALEFAIPLKRASESAPGVNSEPGKVIKVCFEWGGMTDELRKRQIDRLSNSQSRFEQSDKVNARTGSQVAKKYDFWVDVRLAKD